MRDAGSIQFDARPRVGGPMDMSVWSDVTVSAADGGVRIVALDFAETNFSTSPASVVDEATATIAAHDAIAGADAAELQTATESTGGARPAASRGTNTGKFELARSPDPSQAECDRVLAFAIALSPPPLAMAAAEPAEKVSLEAPSTSTDNSVSPPSALPDRAVTVGSSSS